MTVLRAALYERVSTDEQAKYGYSIRTQVDALNEYCKNNKLKIVDHYCDEGVSGGKSALKRPEMARLLQDVSQGKIDIVLFTKLDRWFRNVKEYFKVQEILEANHVDWKAIHEDYDTTTANGEMAITIFLAIAQNERQKTAERLKVVFDNKRKRREAWVGDHCTSFGYKKAPDENGIMRLVKDPCTMDAVQEFWDMVVKYENVTKAGKYVNMTYGLKRTKKAWFDIVYNEIYKGKNKDVLDYCEPYVSPEDWERVQTRRIKKAQNHRVYLFTGLLKCPECGATLRAQYSTSKSKGGTCKEYFSYRCKNGIFDICSNRKTITEIKCEKWLLNNLESLIENEIAKVEIERTKPKKKPKTNINELKEQLRRLEVVYRFGIKSDEEYIAEATEIREQIEKAEAAKEEGNSEKDLSALKETLQTDFKSIYSGLEQEDKRRFWRALIKEIHVEGNEVVGVEFL